MTECSRFGRSLSCALLVGVLGCPQSDADRANEILGQVAAQQPGGLDGVSLKAGGTGVRTVSGKTAEALGSAPVERLPYAAFSWVSGENAVAFSRDAPDSNASSVWLLRDEGEPTRVTPRYDETAVALGIAQGVVSFIRLPPYDPNRTTDPENLLMEVPATGGAPTEIGRIGASRRVLDGGAWRYVALGGGVSVDSHPSRLEAWAKQGDTKVEIASVRGDTVRSLIVFNGSLFWTSHDQPRRPMDHREGHLWRVPLDDHGKPTGKAATPVHSSLDRPEYLAVLGGSLYLLSGGEPSSGFQGSLWRVDPEAKEVTRLVRGMQLPDAFVATERYVCWKGGSMQEWAIECYDPTEDRLVEVHRQPNDAVLSGIAALGRSVLWSRGYASDTAGRTFSAVLP